MDTTPWISCGVLMVLGYKGSRDHMINHPTLILKRYFLPFVIAPCFDSKLSSSNDSLPYNLYGNTACNV
jgi:hypothetical protein